MSGAKVITPTVGRVVWHWPNGQSEGAQPEAALIAYVHSPGVINLHVIGHDGRARPETSVALVQPGDDAIPSGQHCTWMPYQVGQAARTLAAEAAARPAGQTRRDGGAGTD